jgi:hypothetical protein
MLPACPRLPCCRSCYPPASWPSCRCGPAWAWWVKPDALTVLAGTVMLLIAVMVPRSWWSTG